MVSVMENIRETGNSANFDSRFFPVNLLENLPIDKKYVIEEYNDRISINIRRSCKIFKNSLNCELNEVTRIIKSLNKEEYSSLFIFIINVNGKSDQILDETKEVVINFDKSRPLLLHLITDDETFGRIYFKLENQIVFQEINLQQKYIEDFSNFPNFLCFLLNKNIENIVEDIINVVSNVEMCSLSLRVLRTLKLPEELFLKIIYNCAGHGTINALLAALDVPFISDASIFYNKVRDYLTEVVAEVQESNSISSESIQNLAEQLLDDETDSTSETSSTSSVKDSIISVLYTALDNKNDEVINYLISQCTHIIQQLPFEHQVEISQHAFNTNQMEILCDLLEISDFPFPKFFKSLTFTNERLSDIAKQRDNFETNINNEKYIEISDFINKNVNLKYVYNTQNKTALQHAIEKKIYKVYFHLKSMGFKAIEFTCLEHILKGDELKMARQIAQDQRLSNITNALNDANTPIMLLMTRSFIHNRRISIENETEYRSKIRKWYEDIYKIDIGAKLLDVAASCKKLKIIFDFENKTVENVSLSGPNVLGSSYYVSKWIFVGAQIADFKLSEQQREQQIKGILAHELCHYVMGLVYENQENPYYSFASKIASIFDEIVTSIDKWSSNDSNNIDDECNGIISSVFKSYAKNDFHPELIVRVVQILAEFDTDIIKTTCLQAKYKALFDFFNKYILPELREFSLRSRQIVRKINRLVNFLPKILKLNKNIKISSKKNIEELFSPTLVIAVSNVSKILFVNIYDYTRKEHGNLYDSKSIFIDLDMLDNKEIREKVNSLCDQNEKFNVFINFINPDKLNLLKKILRKKYSNFVIVTSKKPDEKLLKSIKKLNLNPNIMEINYNINDLTAESHKMLIQTVLCFQNSINLTFYDLLKIENSSNEIAVNNLASNQEETIIENFLEIVNEQLLNLLIDKSKISVYENIWKDVERNVEFLFQERWFVRNRDNPNQNETNVSHQSINQFNSDNEFKGLQKISQDNLCLDVRNQKFVLISDKAGTGKSWAMLKLTNIIRNQNSSRWVSYVDLKLFTNEFNAKAAHLDIELFIFNVILKENQQFEKNIFKKLYNIGKVTILFDGFDEIAPDYAEYVSKLAKSLKSNGGNQLWIATRDYFEIDLKTILELETVYKLGQFSENDGINFVTRSWLLLDFRRLQEEADFESFVTNSPKYKDYQFKVKRILKKALMSRSQSIGWPQLLNIIGKVFEDQKDEIQIEVKEDKLYRKFAKIQYQRWHTNGEIRNNANSRSLRWNINFWKLHQYIAIKSLFPNYSESFLENGLNEWSNDSPTIITSCGLVTMQDGKLIFLHETFREFFAADFIGQKIDDSVILKIFVEVVTLKKFGIVRMFLNGNIENSNLEALIRSMKDFMEYFYRMETFSDIFAKNQEALADFILNVFNTKNIQNVKKIFNSRTILEACGASKIFDKFFNFLFQVFKNFNEELKIILKTKDKNNSNLFLVAVNEFSTIMTFKNLYKIFLESFKFEEELVALMLETDNKSVNILHYAAYRQSNEIFEFVIEKIETLENTLSLEKIKQFLSNIGDSGEIILQSAVYFFKSPKLHEHLWQMYKRHFSPLEILEFIKHVNLYDNNLVFDAVFNNTIEIVEFTWKQMQELMSPKDQVETLKTIGYRGQNLLERSLENKSNPRVSEWVQNIMNVNEIGEYPNILQEFKPNLEACLSSKNDLDLKILLEDMENLLSPGITIEYFQKRLLKHERILHSLVLCNNFETHKRFWEYLFKNIEGEQLFELILQMDEKRNNFVHNLVSENKECSIIKLTFDKFINNLTIDQLKIILKTKGEEERNLLHIAASKSQNVKIHVILWNFYQNFSGSDEKFLDFIADEDNSRKNVVHIAAYCQANFVFIFMIKKLNKIFTNKIICEKVRKILSNPGNAEENLMQSAVYYLESLKVHKNLWKIYENNFDKKEILVFIKHNNCLKNNLIYDAINNTKETLEFTWNKMKKFMTHEEQIESLKTIGYMGQNLLDRAIGNKKHPEVKDWVRNTIEQYEINKYSRVFDEYKSKIQKCIHSNNEKNLDAMWLTMENIEEFLEQERILHMFVECQNLHVHETLWNLLLKKLQNCEKLYKLILQTDALGNNFLHCLVRFNKNSSIIEFTLKFFKTNLEKDHFEKILTFIGELEGNLLIYAVIEKTNFEMFEKLWTVVKESCNYYKEFLGTIGHCDHIKRNVLQYAACNELEKIFEFMIIEIGKKDNCCNEIRKILSNLTLKKENLLQLAASNLMSPSAHKALWKIYKNNFKPPEMLAFVNHTNSLGNNLICDVVSHNTLQNVVLIWNEIIEFMTKDEQINYLKTYGNNDKNLLEMSSNKNDVYNWLKEQLSNYGIRGLGKNLQS